MIDWCEANNMDHFDFMWLDLEGLELPVLKASPNVVKNVKVIYTDFLEFRKGMTQFSELRSFLESSGFKMISHWYYQGFQGDAIFVKEELLPLGFN